MIDNFEEVFYYKISARSNLLTTLKTSVYKINLALVTL